MLGNYVDIGKRLKEIRENEFGFFSKQDMAELFSITAEHYDAIERGRYLPNVEMLYKMHEHNKDIDYLLTGSKTEKSVFEDVFLNLSDNEKKEVSKLLLYKVKLLNRRNNKETVLETKIKTYKSKKISPYERIKDIIEYENNCKRMKVSEIAMQLGVSERTINRLNKGESSLSTDIIMNVYYKYKYYPSYILCGEINSNSRIDQIYNKSDKFQKDTLMSCARELAAYCGAGTYND